MAEDKQSLELLEATKELKRASSTLSAAGKQFTSDGLLGTGINKIADKIGAKGALEFVIKRKQLRAQDKILKQELDIDRRQLRQLKKSAKIAQAEEQRQKAFKSLSENLLGLSEEQRKKFVSLKEARERGDGRDSSGRFVGNVSQEKIMSGALKEANKENARVAKKSGKSPGDINRAAQEERTAEQQAFEMEKTQSTNDILKDILAALTGDSPLKKDEESTGLGAGLLAGLGAGGLLSKLGKLGKLLLRGSPLLLGIGLLTSGLILLKDRADEFTKKVIDDSKKLTEAVKKAKTPEEIKNVVDESVKQNQKVNQQNLRIRSAEEKKKQDQADLARGIATQEMIKKGKVIEGSQDINDLIKNASVLFAARRDSAIEQGTTLEERFAFFDKSIAETVDKVQSSAAFLGADKKSQEFMIQQVVQAANKAIAGSGGKSRLLSGLGPDAMRDAAAIETRRARMMMALQGGRGEMAEQGFGRLSDLLGGGRNTFSARRVALLEARVAEAQKDADEVSFFERSLGSNQGDIDRLNNLTRELERLRDTIAASDRGGVNVNAPTVTSSDQSKKITIQNTSLINPNMYPDVGM